MGLERSTVALQQALARTPEVKLAYLFGSRVGGNIGPLSDYDVAVLLEEDEAAQDTAYRLAHELASVLGTARVDVVLLNKAPVELAYYIIAQGRLLFERDLATRVEYEAYILSRYGDYLPVLRAQRRELLMGEAYETRIRRHRAAPGRVDNTLAKIRAAKGPASS